ncbi:MAG: hypothetical protein AAF281_14495 [Pseudomonadota bacterium]
MTRTPKPKISLRQQRGSSIAQTVGARARAVVGADRLAVLRDWGTGEIDYPAGTFRTERADVTAALGSDWWATPRFAAWRDALKTAPSLAIRRVKNDRSKTGSVDAWIGVYRILDRSVEPHKIFILFDPERLAEVA